MHAMNNDQWIKAAYGPYAENAYGRQVAPASRDACRWDLTGWLERISQLETGEYEGYLVEAWAWITHGRGAEQDPDILVEYLTRWARAKCRRHEDVAKLLNEIYLG